jgi:hypothetical protein
MHCWLRFSGVGKCEHCETNSLAVRKQYKFYISCSVWNVRSAYRTGSFMTVAKEMSKYKVELYRRSDRTGLAPNEQAKIYFYEEASENRELGTGIYVHQRIISAVKRVKFLSDGISYIILVLRGHWCDITVLNVHTPTEDKIDDMKDSFCRELECVFSKFP